MSSKKGNAVAPRPARVGRRRGPSLCACLIALLPAGADAATLGKTYFFASRDACLASGAFAARECAAAFANARAQLRDKSPRFSGSAECRLHFRLCERLAADATDGGALPYAAEEEEEIYAPAALGVEMIASARGVEAAPTLAVETPNRIFPYFPVSKSYEAQEGETAQAKAVQEKAAILAPDRFVPFSTRKPFTGEVTFAATALGAIEGATAGASPDETREQRRLRLKSAPFVR